MSDLENNAFGIQASSVWAVDVSPVAVAYATFNVSRHNVSDVVQVLEGNWFKPLTALKGKLGGIVCNPPYIPSGLLEGLHAEVSDHEPWLALDGGMGKGADSLQVMFQHCQ